MIELAVAYILGALTPIGIGALVVRSTKEKIRTKLGAVERMEKRERGDHLRVVTDDGLDFDSNLFPIRPEVTE